MAVKHGDTRRSLLKKERYQNEEESEQDRIHERLTCERMP